MYTALLFVHIVCAVIWVGGAVTIQLLAVLVGRSGDPAEVARLMRYFERDRVARLRARGDALVYCRRRDDAPGMELRQDLDCACPSRCGSCPLSRARSISDPVPSASANSSTPKDRRPKQVAP